MQMMYETIYKALVEVGLEGAFSPQDYLNFFCLGNREAIDQTDPLWSGSPTAPNTPEVFIFFLKNKIFFGTDGTYPFYLDVRNLWDSNNYMYIS